MVIGFQSEGCTNYIYFAMQAGVPRRRRTTTSFLLCKYIQISTFIMQFYVPLVLGHL
jgi:hypothetical protein